MSIVIYYSPTCAASLKITDVIYDLNTMNSTVLSNVFNKLGPKEGVSVLGECLGLG